MSIRPRQELVPSGHSGRDPERSQRQRLLLALILLLAAIGVVLFKNWSRLSPEESATAQTATGSAPGADESAGGIPNGNTPAAAKLGKSPKAKPASPKSIPATTITPSVNRTALPPLRVEVYAGDRSVPVKPTGPQQVHVDTSAGTQGRATSEEASPQNASQRVRMPPETLNVLSNPVDPNYPLLAREMKVQGSVILEAFIAKNGVIQELHVVSGPGILANAAMEAVRQWRFKPYYENGEPVETQARITVNFTISTSS